MQDSIKEIANEIRRWGQQVSSLKSSWIWVPGLSGIILVYFLRALDLFPYLLTRTFHEKIAPWIVVAIVFILIIRSIMSKDELIIYLMVLACVFLIRELDDTVFDFYGYLFELKTKNLVSFLLIAMGTWGYLWRKKLFFCLNREILFKLMISGMLFSYFFSQVIARRAFRHVLPDEKLLHIPMEEMTETISHLFFLTVAVCSYFIYKSYRELAENGKR